MEKETLNNNSDASKDNFNWYSLRVISGKEKNVEENIDYETKTNSIENLIEEVREKVFLKTGINIELEIKIIGEK